MRTLIFTCLFIITSLWLKAQVATVNVGNSIGFLDSTFVIQSGVTDTLNSTKHPGAGSYMNAEIYVCQGSTLYYDFGPGTSNIVSFYLDENATLIFPLTASGTIANFYMKNNAAVQIPTGGVLYAYMKREPMAQVAGLPISYMSDSVFTSIQFTFNGWANPCSPTGISIHNNEHEFVQFQNPLPSNEIKLRNTYTKPVDIVFYNSIGQPVFSYHLQPGEQSIPNQVPHGFLYYKISHESVLLQSGQLLRP